MSGLSIYCGHRQLCVSDAPWHTLWGPHTLLLGAAAPELAPKVFEIFVSCIHINRVCILGSPDDALPRALLALFTPITACGGVVQNDQGEILMIQRNGLPDLPKGKLEPGETLEQAALREVQEETGVTGLHILRSLTSTLHCYQMDGRWWLKTTHWYAMHTSSVSALTPQQEEGISAAEWLSESRVHELAGRAYPTIQQVMSAFLAQ